MITYKTDKEINILRESAKIAVYILNELKKNTRPGINTMEIEYLSEKLLKKNKVIGSFKNYNGYPYNICISINEEIVHGTPGRRIIKDTDIVSIDFGVKYKKFNSDCAITLAMPKTSKKDLKLIKITKLSLEESINNIKKNQSIDIIANKITEIANNNNLSVVKNLSGHGIGKSLQEEPQILNETTKKSNIIFRKGMVFCIEPMLTTGNGDIKILSDGWTISTKDNTKSAHFEHMIAITDDKIENLTKALTNF